MSKLKKGLALTLAVIMAFSSMLTVFAEFETLTSGYTYGSKTVKNPSGSFWVDTSETTEIIRVHSSTNKFGYGNVVCAATPSGMPEVASTGFQYAAYAGETAEYPKVVLKIYGLAESEGINTATITADKFTSSWSEDPTITAGTDSNGSYVKYTWSISAKDNVIVPDANKTDGTNNVPVTYVITFDLDGRTYTELAYATVKDILRPAGSDLYLYNDDKTIRTSNITYMLGANMTSGFASSTVGRTRSYLNFESSINDAGDALSGAGVNNAPASADAPTAFNITDNAGGSITYRSYSEDYAAKDGCHTFTDYATSSTDGNRAVATIYVDRGYDHLGKGTGTSQTGNASANGLNMRLVLKAGEGASGFGAVAFNRVGVRSDVAEGFACEGQNDTTQNTAIFGSTNYPALAQLAVNANDEHGNRVVGSVRTASGIDGGDGSTTNSTGLTAVVNAKNQLIASSVKQTGNPAYSTSSNKPAVWASFSGYGPTSESANWSVVYQTIFSENANFEQAQGGCDNDYQILRGRQTTAITLSFKTYDTTALRTSLNSIKQQNPQKWQYYIPSGNSAWTNFVAAYSAAGAVIADFATTQSAVNTAKSNLDSAWNTLQSYASTSNGNIYVRHLLVDGNGNVLGKLLNDEIITVDVNNNPIVSGAAFTVNAASGITGYVATGATTLNGQVVYESSGAAHYYKSNGDEYTGDSVVEEGGHKYLVFKYVGQAQSLTIITNNGYNNNAGYYFTSAYTTGQMPDFTTILNAIGGKDHYDYAGLYRTYSDGVYSNPVNTSTYVLPAGGDTMYIKWTPTVVKLKVTPNVTAVSEQNVSDTYPTEGADGALSDITFDSPTPATVSGYEFLGYYSDAECTEQIEWPMTASYTNTDAYQIQTGTGFNYVQIYSKYVNLSNKIVFDAQGGTMPATNPDGLAIVDGEMSYSSVLNGQTVSFPVPTKAGYEFKYWADADGNPISAWYDVVGGEAVAKNPSELVKGTNLNTTGFIATAVWDAVDITITFHLNIQDSSNIFNSNDDPYYAQITVKADTKIDADNDGVPDTALWPSNPQQYGKDFNYWSYDGAKFSYTGKYPTQDITLTATWKDSNEKLFVDLSSYVILSDVEHPTDTDSESVTNFERTKPGDYVTIRFTASGNFFAASSSFIFAYDKSFFEKIDNVDVFELNQDNGYVSEIKAVKAENINSDILNTVYGSYITSYADYGVAAGNVGLYQLSVNPDVDQLTSYKTVSMSDSDYLVTVRLKVKESATGTGTFWLPSELLRTGTQTYGDTFVANTSVEKGFEETKTTNLSLSENAYTTIDIGDEARPQTTVTIYLPKDSNDQYLGEFDDGTTTPKTYTGHAENEIFDFKMPEREGYTVAGYYGYNPTTGAIDHEDELVGGFYGTTEQNGKSYIVEWEPIPYQITLYYEKQTEVYTVLDVAYGMTYDDIIADTVRAAWLNRKSNISRDFIGWVPMGQTASTDNVVSGTGSSYVVTSDDAWYMYYLGAQKEVKFVPYYIELDNTDPANPQVANVTIPNGTLTLTKDMQTALGIVIRLGDTVSIVNSMPETPANGVVYILASDLEKLFKGTYLQEGETVSSFEAALTDNNVATNRSQYRSKFSLDTSQLPLTFTVDTTASENVLFTAQNATVTFNADGGTYTGTLLTDNGDGTYSYTNKHYSKYDYTNESKKFVKTGYVYKSLSAAVTHNITYRSNLIDNTYTVLWNPADVRVHYADESGSVITALDTATKGKYDSAAVTLVNKSNANAPVKEGYTLTGWALATYDSATSTCTKVSGATGAATLNINDNQSLVNQADDGTYHIYVVPVFEINKYTITYKTSTDGAAAVAYNPGEGYGSAEYNTNYTVAGDAAAVEGFTFDGWYYATDTARANKVTAINPITEDKVLVGYYDPITYKVKFVSKDDNSTIAYSDVAYGKVITAPTETFTKAGHTLAGWTTTENGTEVEVAAVGGTFPTLTVAEDNAVVYYAVWTPNQKNYNINVIYEGIEAQGIADVTDTKVVTGSRVGDTVYAENKDEYARTGFEYDEDQSNLSGTIPAADGETLNLTVFYKRSSYTYTKVVNGTTSTIGTYLYGQTVATVEDPVVEGYTFSGWTPAKVTTMPAEPYEITAVLTIKSFTIDFNLKGGSGSIQPITANYAASISLPTSADVTYTGYDFGGWKYGDEVVNWTTMPDLGTTGETVTLEAVWTPHEYSVTFHFNDGVTADSSDNVAFGSAITKPENPEKEGWGFAGWYTDPEFTSSQFQSWTSMPAQNLDLYAKFTINTYEITFDAGEGEFTSQSGYTIVMYNKATLTGDYDTDVVAPTAVTRDGYYLTGWNNLPAKMPANNTTTVTANWQVEQYRVVFITNGGESVEAKTYTYGDAVTLPDTTKDGYNFGGWYFDNNTFEDYFGKGAKTIGDLGDSNATVTAEVLVYAKWTEDEFPVVFHGNNGKWGTETDKSFDVLYGSEIVAPENPERPGYTFTGWYTAETDGDQLATGTTLTTLGAEYYAHWDANELTVTFNPNNGNWDGETTNKVFSVYMDAAIAPVVPSDPARYGYTFAGWNTASDGTGTALETGSTLTNAEGETYFAQWTPNTYDAKFYDLEGHLYDTVNTAFDSIIAEPTKGNPTRTGYEFNGWEGFTANSTTMTSEDGMEFTAKWNAVAYAAEFISEGVTMAKPMVNYDDPITYTGATPGKFGHTFAGWSLTAGGEVLDSLGTMDSTDGKTFYAVFTPDTITVTFHGNNGLWGEEDTATAQTVFGQTTVAPDTLPVREGYTAKGISSDPDADPATASFALPALTDPTVEYYYIWDLNQYDITFNANEGKWTDDETTKTVPYFHFEQVSAYTPAPEKYGYAFVGWSATADGRAIDFANDAPTVTGEKTYYAIYDYSSVKVVYMVTKDGTTYETYDSYYVLFNDTISAIPYDEYGYELENGKWYTDDGRTTEFTGTTVASTDTIYVYGKAVSAEFEVSYYAEGGTFTDGTEGETKTVTKAYGSNADDVAVTKSGYTFTGWTPDLSTVYGDTEYHAVWSAKVYDITFNFNGDTANETETISSAYGEDIDAPATDGRKDGYNFLGWYADSSLATPLTWESIVEAAGTGTAVEAYASWSADSFAITFDPANGSDPYTVNLNYDDVILGEDEKNITNTGYCYAGWADEAGNIISDTSTVTGKQTYTAQWTPATVTIKYYFVEDGRASLVEFDTADYGTDYTVLGYTNGEYTVAKWNTADAAVVVGSTLTIAQTGVITLTATAGVDTESGTKHFATFDPNGGEFPAGTVYEFYLAEGEVITVPADPTMTGYTFVGWDEEPATMGEADVTFTAVWKANTYSITYVYVDENDVEQTIDVISQKYGENYEIPAEPDVTNYVFTGWKFDGTTNTISSASLEALTVEADAKIYAVLTQDAYYVSFYSFGTEEGADPLNGTCNVLVETKPVGAGDGLITASAPEYDNFVFNGWFTAATGGTEYKEGDPVTGGNLSLYAQYSRVVVKLIPKEGSTAMIERNGIVETYNTEYTVGTNAPFGVTSIVAPITDKYGEYDKNFETYYVYGLCTRLTEEALMSYVDVQGDGKIEVTLSGAGSYGTGAIIKVIDNVTGTTVEQFYIVIFGDLNGDSLVTSTDTSVFSKESKDKVWSEGETKVGYKLKAADLSADGNFSSTDTSVVKAVVRQAKKIDQNNGTAYDNAD